MIIMSKIKAPTTPPPIQQYFFLPVKHYWQPVAPPSASSPAKLESPPIAFLFKYFIIINKFVKGLSACIPVSSFIN